MKYLSSLILIVLAFLALPAMAQDNSKLITLNDATPAIDVVISLPDNTTGTVALDIADAVVMVKDASGNVVFQSADSRIHAIEMNIMPNSGTHTLTVERLAGVSQAFVSVTALSELTIVGTVELTDSHTISLNQEASLNLDSSHLGDSFSVSIPGDSDGIITASFLGTATTTQLLDANGVVIAQSMAGHIDGLNFVVASGDYQFTLLSSNLTQPVVAGVRVMSVVDGGFGTLAAQTAANSLENTGTVGEACYASIAMSSVNFRSGPGTAYNVIGYGYREQSFVVGGRNDMDNWVLIVKEDGSTAWMSSSVAQFEGSCANMTVFNIPTRDAQPAQVVITTPEPSTVYVVAPSSNVGSSNNSGEHHDDDDEHEEHDDD